jgi:hypothetical protein
MNYIFFPLFINLISPNYSLIINIYFCLQNSQETRKQLASNSQATRKQLASNSQATRKQLSDDCHLPAWSADGAPHGDV